MPRKFPKICGILKFKLKNVGDIMDYQDRLFGILLLYEGIWFSCLDFEMFDIPNYRFTKLLSKFVDPYAIILKKNV